MKLMAYEYLQMQAASTPPPTNEAQMEQQGSALVQNGLFNTSITSDTSSDFYNPSEKLFELYSKMESIL